MHPLELKELIADGESSKLEFKRKANSPAKLAKEIAAFANTIGGILLIGVDDDGTIVGVKSEKSEIDIIETACNFNIEPQIEPEIEIVNVSGKDVVIAYIDESKKKPHKIIADGTDEENFDNRVYIRLGEKSVIASREMIRLMSYQTSDKAVKLSIGDKEKRLFAYLDVHEKATVADFAKLTNISRRRAERLLIRLVRAGVLQIHNNETQDFFTLVGKRT